MMRHFRSICFALIFTLIVWSYAVQFKANPAQATITASSSVAIKAAAVTFAQPEIPGKSVKFCHLPFLDHTEAIIGLQKGWFKDVGIRIEPAPNGSVILPPQRAAAHASGQCEVSSGATGAAIALHKQMPDLVMFVVGDIFQGDAILAQPDSKYKRYQDFIREGVSPAEAVKRTMAQMKRKTWAVALAPATQFSSNLFLEQGGIKAEELTIVSVDDAKTVELMIAKRADFQLGGAPARVELEGKGYYPIITIADIAGQAKPSVDSLVQRAIYPDGWMISRKIWERDPDLVLRMASVMWRIADFIVKRPSLALAIHVPFLNSVSGRSITEPEAKKIYLELDPFYTFEQNAKLFVDRQNPLYWEWELGSKIKAQVQSGVYKEGELRPSDVTIAPEVYHGMVSLRKKSDDLMAMASEAMGAAQQKGADVSAAGASLAKARVFYAAYDFLDAKRFAEAVYLWANKARAQ